MPPDPTASSTAAERWRRFRTAARPGNVGIVYALGLLVLILIVACSATGRPSYISGVNIANILDQSALAAILAIFITIVLVSGNFDLSVASTAALSAAISLKVMDDQGLVVALLLGLAVGFAIGLINGSIVEFVGINAFIVTLGTLTAVRGLVLIISGGNSISVDEASSYSALSGLANEFWTINLLLAAGVVLLLATAAVVGWQLATRRSAWPPTRTTIAAGAVGLLATVVGIVAPVDAHWSRPVWYMLILGLIVWAVLRYTTVGRRLYAVGGNHEAARLSGVNVRRYRVVPFVLSGLAAGFVGVVYGAKLGAVNPDALNGTELTVLAAAILGGTSLFGGSGSVVMSIVGTLFLFTIANGFNVLNLGSNYQSLIQGVILILAAGVYTVAKRRERVRVIDAPANETDPPESPRANGAMASARVG